VLTNLWYVAEWSKAVSSQPLRVKMLGFHFVLFRDDQGKVHCLSDTCIHRGGALGNGVVRDNCITCPYHGWEFTAQGQLDYVPSMGPRGEPQPLPDNAHIDSYPVQERYGLIWVFLGDLQEEDRYPIPPLPEYDSPNWRSVTGEYTWNANAARVLENGIDLAHISFVHPSFGFEQTAHMNRIEKLERHDWWATSSCSSYTPKGDGTEKTMVHPTFYLSAYSLRMHIEINEKRHNVLFDANTPVDEHTTRTFVISLRNFNRFGFFDGFARRGIYKTLFQDAAVVEAVTPLRQPLNNEGELSVHQDKFMSLWRHTYSKHVEEKGWKIDSEKIDATSQHKQYAIPSPKRREYPGIDWVVDPVPLVPASDRLSAKITIAN